MTVRFSCITKRGLRGYSSAVSQKKKFSLVRYSLGITALSGVTILGTGYAATKFDKIKELWLENVPDGERFLRFISTAEDHWKSLNLDTIVSDATQTLSSKISEVSDSAPTSMKDVEKLLTDTSAMVSQVADWSTQSASHTYEVALDGLQKAEVALSSFVKDAETTFESLKDTVTRNDIEKEQVQSALVQESADHRSIPLSKKDGNMKSEALNPVELIVEPVPTIVSEDNYANETVPISERDVMDEDRDPVKNPDAEPFGSNLISTDPPVTINLNGLLEHVSVDTPELSELAVSIHALAEKLEKLSDNTLIREDIAQKVKACNESLHRVAKHLEHVKADHIAFFLNSLQEQAEVFDDILTDFMIESDQALLTQREQLENSFQNHWEEQKATLMNEFNITLQSALDQQTQDFRNALDIDLQRQATELERFWSNEVKTRLDQERDGRLARLDHLALKLKYLERITLEASQGFNAAYAIHHKSAVIKTVEQFLSKPFTGDFSREIRLLLKLYQDDELANSSLKRLTEVRNFVSHDELVLDFYGILPQARVTQLMPETAGPFSYILASFLSYFIIPKVGIVPGNDFEAVVARAKFYLDLRDVENATRELNQLHGWPKVLFQEWLAKSRLHLEVVQAIDVLRTDLNIQSLGHKAS